MPPFSESATLAISETQKSPESLFFKKSFSTSELSSTQSTKPKRPLKHLENDCTYNLVLFQNLMKEMEEIKWLIKSTD